MHIKADTLDDLMHEAFSRLIKSSIQISTTRGITRELTGVLFELSRPRARLSRSAIKGKIFSALGEFLWYMAGTNALSFIEYYLPKYRDDSEDGFTIYGGYGPRLLDMSGHDQISNIISQLKSKPTSRRAVIQIFNASDISKPRKEIPCTCMMQFLLRDKQLHMFTTMRSNDAYVGLPHDIFAFTMIHELVSKSIGASLGTYKHFVGSLHLYNSNLEQAQLYVDEGLQSTRGHMPPMPKGDQWANVGKLLKIEHHLRNNISATVDYASLPKYWSDLAKLLQLYSYSRLERFDSIGMARVRSEIHSPIYKMYVDDRISQKLLNDTDAQFALPFA